jgi:ribose 5-phosphate isomerase A
MQEERIRRVADELNTQQEGNLEMTTMNGKQVAAQHAAEFIKDGMTVGLGTGSTSAFAIEAIGKRVQQGISIKAVASSIRSEDLARQQGITLIPFAQVESIDIYIDGADEVDSDLNLIKGGGGALLREKILAFNSKQFLVIVDDSKLVEHLGKFLLPVEVTSFAKELTIRQLHKLGCSTTIRQDGNEPYITDNGNFIVDCDFRKIEDVPQVNHSLKAIPGVVENGLFLRNIVHKVIVGYKSGEVRVLDK